MNNVDFHTKNENHDLSLKPGSNLTPNLECIHFRCPNCSKLYSSDPSRIYVEEPEYTCSKCKTEFSISLLFALQQSEVVGVEVSPTVESINTEALTVDLPQVKPEEIQIDLRELQQEFDFETLEKGGVTFNELVQEDMQMKAEEKLQGKFESQWDLVMADYESRDVHNQFISFCKTEKNVDFAIGKYAKLVEINPNDKLAVSFLKRIQFTIESRAKFESLKNVKIFTKSFYITLGIVCCGLFLIFMGSLWFQNKNIAGLGIGLIFFTFAAKAFFQPRRFEN